MRKFMVLLVVIFAVSFCSAELQSALQEGPVSLKNLGQYKRALAVDLAQQLKNKELMDLLAANLTSRNSSMDLVPCIQNLASKAPSRSSEELWQNVVQLDKEIREIKGIADRVDYILEIRLAFPQRGWSEDLLVTYIPSGNERSWKHIEAFDAAGNVHYLDVHKAPETQVLVVGLNARRDMQAGLALMNEELRKAGMQTAMPEERTGLQVAKLDKIHLDDDQEPWVSGDAEIYSLVNGIAPESARANVIAMDMPYLDDDEKDYYPNQVLIVWNNYRYKAANINFYEHDDGTNYKEIVAMLIEKIGNVVPEYKYIFEIASQIIKLMPDQWFTNDDDYVDVFYTLEMGKTYTDYMGASRNAKITLVPYVIPE